MKWMFIIIMVIALSLNGCAKDASGSDQEDPEIRPNEEVEVNKETVTDMIWIAIVLTWNPVNYTIDKEFASEVACWNYYEESVGESKFGTQVLDHQGNKPDKEYMNKHRPPHREYPTRLYNGVDGWTRGLIWLTCDIKQQ
jgi:hypothetical protein